MLFALALAELTEGGMSPERLEDIVDRYGQTILRTAYLYLKDRQRAEDVCQEVFIKLFRENKEFENQSHEKAWILRVTINLCKDQLKSWWRKRRVPLEESIQCEDGGSLPDETLEKVLALPPQYREALYLYYYEGYSTPELASILHKKEATIRSYLHRGRALLKMEIGGNES